MMAKQPELKCPTCNGTSIRLVLLHAGNKWHETLYECMKCGKRFTVKESFAEHVTAQET